MFEDFSLHSDACPNKWPGIWLAFGGDVRDAHHVDSE